MKILAIDPGPTESAFVLLDSESKALLCFAKLPNDTFRDDIAPSAALAKHIIIERVACYGMAVGEAIFQTCFWTGRLIELLSSRREKETVKLVTRVAVKMALCHQTAKVNDAVIRQRLIDMYGGKESAIGAKKKPGPLYGVKADVWAALAVGVAFLEGAQCDTVRK